MSAAPHYPPELGYSGLRMTAGEYAELGESADRYELIDGVVVMSPSPTVLHQQIVFEVTGQLWAYRQSHVESLIVSDTDLYLSGELVYRPDVCAYRTGIPVTPEARLTTPPDFVVEVLSRGNRPLDLFTKRDDYDRFGVLEYIVIDPDDGAVRHWRRGPSALTEVAVQGTRVPILSLPGFELDIARVRSMLPKRHRS
jgi:Uma2 family endonuclease